MGSGRRVVTAGLAIAAAISACTHAPVAPSHAAVHAAPERPAQQARVPDEYLVSLAPDVDERVISEFYGRFGIKELDALGDGTYLLVLTNDPGPQAMEALVSDDTRFRAVQPNIIYWANRTARKAK